MILIRNTMVDLKMPRLVICLGSVLLLVASSVAAQSNFDKGAAAYKRGDYATALAIFRPLAESGDAKAQSILALMYSYGEGVPVDYREAARWYRRAAEQNSSVAQYNLGMLYLEGRGVPQDTDEGIEWLTRAADGGHFRARSELAKRDAGSYSNLMSSPSASLEAPPTLIPEESEPRSVVMQTPPPKPSAPEVRSRTAEVVMVSAAAATPATQTNNHARVDEKSPVNGKVVGDEQSEHTAPASPPAARNNGAYRVQLAASRSEEYIRRDWSSYQQHYGDIFAGLDASFERAEIGEEKTVWYRLRVGPFASEASARELCEKLSARGIKTGCLPLRTTP
jgi:hypothetical protein